MNDTRFALRQLRKNPGFTSVAALTLALGIGANAAIFTLVDAVLLQQLPVEKPEELVLFASQAPREFSAGSYNGNSERDAMTGARRMTSFPLEALRRLRVAGQENNVLSSVFAFGNVDLTVNANEQSEVASGQAVSGHYFFGLGVQPLLGRVLLDSDDRPGAHPAAVLSYRYWQQRFNGDRGIVGRQINLNNVPFTVVGVTPPGFDGTMGVGSSQDITIAIVWEPQIYLDKKASSLAGAGSWWLRVMGRLKPGVTADQARAQLQHAFNTAVLEHRAARQATAQATGGNAVPDLDPKVAPQLLLDSGGQGEMNARRRFAPSLYLLQGGVVLILLIACANVANLLLSRAASRQKEVALRLAIGAGRGRLIRQFLTESIVLSLLGGVLGIAFALAIQNGFLAVTDWAGGGMRSLEPSLNWRVLGFASLVSLATGLLFGVVPALRSTKLDLAPTLKDGGRGSSAFSRSWLSNGLVVSQVAISLLLLVGAGLFVRTLINLQGVDTGFNAQNLLLFRVQPGLVGYEGDRLARLYEQMTERIEAIPGVSGITFSRHALLAQGASSTEIYLRSVIDRPPDAEGRFPSNGGVHMHHVRENYLETMGIGLLRGRTLRPQDDAAAPRVAVVNETFAAKYFPGIDAVGQRFAFDRRKPDDLEIVGVSRDAKYSRQRDAVPPTVYLSWRQELPRMGMAMFEVRTATPPTALVSAVRQTVREIDQNLPLSGVKSQVEQANETLRLERFFAKLMTLFGVVAQVLASIGLFGVMAYAVSQRTREIGIRIALGARRADVLRMTIRQGMTVAVLGVVVGLGTALAATRLIEHQLFGVTRFDLVAFAVAAASLLIAAFLACAVPARRATQVHPMEALRQD
jgi:predicted permease